MEHSTNLKTSQHVTATQGVDGAGGVPKTQWFVAIVNNRAEQKTAELMFRGSLQRAYECYVPTQSETRVWKNGKKKVIDRILLPALLFAKCTEADRIQSLRMKLVNRYMVDHSRGTRGHYGIAIVPDEQIQQLKDMLTRADTPVTIEDARYRLGDKDKVKEGPLSGFIGNVVTEPTATYLVLRLDNLGFAKVQVDQNNVEKVG